MTIGQLDPALTELLEMTTVDLCIPALEVTPNACEHRRAKIMIVDDVPINAKVVQAQLGDAGYEQFIAVTDSTEAMATIHRERPDIVLLDLMMPEVSGLEILAGVRSDSELIRLPVLILTAAESSDMKREALELGATDFLTKPVDAAELIPRVRNCLLTKNYQDELEQRIRDRTAELERSRKEIILCLARAAEYRDNETGRHVIRVACYAGIIGCEMGLDPNIICTLKQAATLHDLGKMGIPDEILLKPGKLTTEEFDLMKKHCAQGAKVVEPFSTDEFTSFLAHTTLGATIMSGCNSPVMHMARIIALTHHERWDGTGYPLGLSGEHIPIEGRITAVADVFDALSSRRPYKPAFPLEKCLAILEESRGSHFDPTVLDAFFARQREIVDVQLAYADLE